MKPDRPPEDIVEPPVEPQLKPERIQDAPPIDDARSFLDRLFEALEWINAMVERLLSLFRLRDDDPS